jgi:hypothetical protein
MWSGVWLENCTVVHVSSLALIKSISERILLIRGEKVILDADLAGFYGVATKRLNEQVRRNSGRFPDDFVFRLTLAEKTEVVAKCDHLRKLRFSKALPIAFTEHGALMAANVLSSPQAIDASVLVVRTFIQLRRIMATSTEVAGRLAVVEKQLADHETNIASIIEALRQLSTPSTRTKRRIGFGPLDSKTKS